MLVSHINLNDFFNDYVESNEWSTLHCKGDTPEARKNHIGVLVGTHVLIHGGTNSFSKCLKDAIILDLGKYYN